MLEENKVLREEFTEEVLEKNNFSEEYAYKLGMEYELKVEPFLNVIRSERAKEDRLEQKEIAYALGVSPVRLTKMKRVFSELSDSLETGKNIMHFKAQIDLQKGLINSEFTNAKMLEMQMIRYDDKYKPKGDKTEVELPKTLNIVFEDASMSDEELEKVIEEE